MKKDGLAKMIFISIQQRDMQLKKFKPGRYLIDQDSPLVVYISFI